MMKTPPQKSLFGTTLDLSRVLALLVLLIAGVLVANAAWAQNWSELPPSLKPTKTRSNSISVPQNLVMLGPNLESYFPSRAVVVDKNAKTLSIWEQGPRQIRRIATFPVDVGKRQGDKMVEGDLKTPEGIYFILDSIGADKLNFSLYGSHAFTTNYPNAFDQIRRKTGSGIWLHSIPDNNSLERGSRGCVVVRENSMQKIRTFIKPPRTALVIQEKVEYVSPKRLLKQRIEILNWLSRWRKDWQSFDLKKYGRHYHKKQFSSQRMDWKKWMNFKGRIFRRSKKGSISVKIHEPIILVEKGRAVVRFLQSFKSKSKSDYGEKTLYLKKENQWKIVSETWKKAPRPEDSQSPGETPSKLAQN